MTRFSGCVCESHFVAVGPWLGACVYMSRFHGGQEPRQIRVLTIKMSRGTATATQMLCRGSAPIQWAVAPCSSQRPPAEFRAAGADRSSLGAGQGAVRMHCAVKTHRLQHPRRAPRRWGRWRWKNAEVRSNIDHSWLKTIVNFRQFGRQERYCQQPPGAFPRPVPHDCALRRPES